MTGAAQVADLDLSGGRLVEKVPGLQVSVSDVEIVEVLEKKYMKTKKNELVQK